MFLTEIVVHSPRKRFSRLGTETEQFVLETVGGLRLICAIDQPVVDCETVVDRESGAKAHMVIRQKVEPVRTRIIQLILCIVAFYAKRAAPLAEVNVPSFAQRNDIGSVSLEDIAIDFRARFVRRI